MGGVTAEDCRELVRICRPYFIRCSGEWDSKRDPVYMKDYCNYLLIHEMNKHYLNEMGYKYVN